MKTTWKKKKTPPPPPNFGRKKKLSQIVIIVWRNLVSSLPQPNLLIAVSNLALSRLIYIWCLVLFHLCLCNPKKKRKKKKGIHT